MRFLFRLLPWWLFAFFALAFLPVTLQLVEGQWATYKRLEAAEAQPAPVLRPAVEFDPRRDVTRAGEVAVSELVQVTPDVNAVATASAELVYLVFMSRDARRAFVAYDAATDREAFVKRVNAARGAGGYSELRGFMEANGAQPELRDVAFVAVREFGLDGDDVFVVEPYPGTRLDGLRAKRGEAAFVAGFVALVQGVLGLVAYFKWRSSRRRRARSPIPPRAAAPVAGPWGNVHPNAVATPRPEQPSGLRRVGRRRKEIGDGFDRSPIKSTRSRWPF